MASLWKHFLCLSFSVASIIALLFLSYGVVVFTLNVETLPLLFSKPDFKSTAILGSVLIDFILLLILGLQNVSKFTFLSIVTVMFIALWPLLADSQGISVFINNNQAEMKTVASLFTFIGISLAILIKYVIVAKPLSDKSIDGSNSTKI